MSLLLLFWLKMYALIYARMCPFLSMLTITHKHLQSPHLVQTHHVPDAAGNTHLWMGTY